MSKGRGQGWNLIVLKDPDYYIRWRYNYFPHLRPRHLCKEYGVTYKTMYRILNGTRGTRNA